MTHKKIGTKVDPQQVHAAGGSNMDALLKRHRFIMRDWSRQREEINSLKKELKGWRALSMAALLLGVVVVGLLVVERWF